LSGEALHPDEIDTTAATIATGGTIMTRYRALNVAVGMLCVLTTTGALAVPPEEIQVYLDDLTKPGHFGADLHNNFVLSGSRSPDFSGALPARHLYRFTPELYYGVSDTFEIGLYLLSTIAPAQGAHYDGEKIRFKYIPRHDEDQGPFWGLNLEIGKTSTRVSEVPWNAQLKGIYGLRTGPWTVGFNANFDWSLAGSPATPVSLELDTKVSYDIRKGLAIGFESYNELGPLRDPGPLHRLGQTLYATVDAQLRKVDLNVGLGRGLTPVSDRWTLKFIVGLQY
jgi:hypothetical protein